MLPMVVDSSQSFRRTSRSSTPSVETTHVAIVPEDLTALHWARCPPSLPYQIAPSQSFRRTSRPSTSTAGKCASEGEVQSQSFRRTSRPSTYFELLKNSTLAAKSQSFRRTSRPSTQLHLEPGGDGRARGAGRAHVAIVPEDLTALHPPNAAGCGAARSARRNRSGGPHGPPRSHAARRDPDVGMDVAIVPEDLTALHVDVGDRAATLGEVVAIVPEDLTALHPRIEFRRIAERTVVAIVPEDLTALHSTTEERAAWESYKSQSFRRTSRPSTRCSATTRASPTGPTSQSFRRTSRPSTSASSRTW